MRHFVTLLIAVGTFAGVCATSTEAAAQSASYCPVYAENNWRLSLVERDLFAWKEAERGSTVFDDHLKFCKQVFRDDSANARQILRDEWGARFYKIVDRLPNWVAQDMVAYLDAWPENLAYICNTYAGFNGALSQLARDLDVDIGSLDESEHRDFCVDSIYRNNDQGAEAQGHWAGRYDFVMERVQERSPR